MRLFTLHSYILRELLKTFGLTLAALTALFTMGGGLYDVVSYEGVSAADIFRFIPLLIPIVVTITMPMAALFAATMVYGRLAADNELIACRAAGINVHRTFLSGILLAVFVAIFTLLFGSFIIPGFMQRIENFARNNISDIARNSLQNRGFIHRDKEGDDRYTLTAEWVQPVSDSALESKGFEVDRGLHYLLIKNPTFMQIDKNGNLLRFAVAKWGMCIFDVRSTPIELTLLVRDGRDFELVKSAVSTSQQQIGPVALPVPGRVQLSFAALTDLFTWRQQPWRAPDLADKLQNFLRELTREQFFVYGEEALADGRKLTLDDDRGGLYTISCRGTRPGRGSLILDDATVTYREAGQEQPIRYEAHTAELVGAPVGDRLFLEIRLLKTPDHDVLEYNPRFTDSDRPRPKPTQTLEGVSVPERVLADMRKFPAAAVLDPNTALPINDTLADHRAALQKAAQRMVRKINATIHFRLGFTLSVLVTAIMGAALGVIFRGARILSAFALALIPFFTVAILMVLGRQLAESAGTQHIGPFVTWGGLLLVLVADLVILRVGVRR